MLRIVVPFLAAFDGDRSDPEQMQFQQALWELYVAERNFHEATGEMVIPPPVLAALGAFRH